MKQSQIELILKMTGLPVEAIKEHITHSVGLDDGHLENLSLSEFREVLAEFMQNVLLEAKLRENVQPHESFDLAKVLPLKKTPTC